MRYSGLLFDYPPHLVHRVAFLRVMNCDGLKYPDSLLVILTGTAPTRQHDTKRIGVCNSRVNDEHIGISRIIEGHRIASYTFAYNHLLFYMKRKQQASIHLGPKASKQNRKWQDLFPLFSVEKCINNTAFCITTSLQSAVILIA